MQPLLNYDILNTNRTHHLYYCNLCQKRIICIIIEREQSVAPSSVLFALWYPFCFGWHKQQHANDGRDSCHVEEKSTWKKNRILCVVAHGVQPRGKRCGSWLLVGCWLKGGRANCHVVGNGFTVNLWVSDTQVFVSTPLEVLEAEACLKILRKHSY